MGGLDMNKKQQPKWKHITVRVLQAISAVVMLYIIAAMLNGFYEIFFYTAVMMAIVIAFFVFLAWLHFKP